MADPTSYDELFPGRFLKAGLMKGRPVTLTIRRIYHEKLVGKKGEEKKAIIAFAETELGYIPCKTVGMCMRAMFGSHLPDWIGKRVTLYPSRDRGAENWFDNEEAIRCYGSPDIDGPITVTIEHPRKKPRIVRLEKTATRTAQSAATATSPQPTNIREPGEDG